MRLWEIVLIGLAVVELIFLFFPAVTTEAYRWVAVVTLAVGVAAAFHLFSEGARWQMAPVYAVVIATTAVLLWRIFGLPAVILPWPTVGLSIGLLALLIGVSLSLIFPIPDMPTPDGPFSVGTVTYHLVDPSRPEPYTADPDDVREFMVQLWYPAAPEPAVKPASYFPDAQRMIAAIAGAMELPPFLLNHVALINSSAKPNVAVASGSERFPVILFSHGYGSTRIQSTTLMETLASHGYIVAGLDHTYGAAVTVFPDGRVALLSPDALTGEGAAFRRSGIRLVDGWVGDLEIMATKLVDLDSGAIDSPLTGRINLDRLGIMGHSTGGGAAARFCATDGRCRAAIGLDAWLGPVPEDLLVRGTSVPFLFFMSEYWPKPENIGYIATYMAHSPASTWITLAGSDHYDFTDAPFLSPLLGTIGLEVGIDPQLGHALTERVVVGFFDEMLLGQPGRFSKAAADPLLRFDQNEVFQKSLVRE